MDFFNSSFFWFLEGILFTIILMAFHAWAKDKHINMSFLRWTAFVSWLLFFGFTLAFITTSIGENEPAAAFRGGILFGILTIISGVGVWRYIKAG